MAVIWFYFRGYGLLLVVRVLWGGSEGVMGEN